MGGKMEAKWLCNACVLYVGGSDVTIDLVLLHMPAFDAILGMDWLAQHRVVLDCFFEEGNISNLQRFIYHFLL